MRFVYENRARESLVVRCCDFERRMHVDFFWAISVDVFAWIWVSMHVRTFILVRARVINRVLLPYWEVRRMQFEYYITVIFRVSLRVARTYSNKSQGLANVDPSLEENSHLQRCKAVSPIQQTNKTLSSIFKFMWHIYIYVVFLKFILFVVYTKRWAKNGKKFIVKISSKINFFLKKKKEIRNYNRIDSEKRNWN